MSEYVVVPYCEFDGVRTYKDSFIMELYDKMVEEGTADTVFSGSGIDSPKSFLAMAKGRPDEVLFYLLFVDGEVGGIAWLNRFQYRWAQFHFCTFKRIWGRETIGLAKHTLERLLTLGGEGNYLFDMFVGIMPSRNSVGLAYVQKCGGVVSGTLPYGVFNQTTGESEEATIITLTREGLR